jgi:hypothetical protein
MPPEHIIETVCSTLPGIVAKSSWGETALFYNPGHVLPNGVYFCTIKQQDGENDKASHLDRDGVFRVAIGLTRPSYFDLFGHPPERPGKGAVVATGHDFKALDKLMPHPVYGWMCWAQILNPTSESFAELLPLIAEAHGAAVTKFAKKTALKTVRNRSKTAQGEP